MEDILEKKILINAPAAEVWKLLTDTRLMTTWMGSGEMDLEISTSWEVGTPILIKGFHHVKFQNKGTVMEYVPGSVVSYNFLSSISRLPNKPENHTTLRFVLKPGEDKTTLLLTISNFPTEEIYHHLNFYWNVTLAMLSRQYA
ncbi:SRPBCC domain-containing protein [Chitinophaga filiformis]|uniref:SRPBCC domain-containing protein n=1 Tax=Chitinophaga filiformis TaxID=104663 RepID=A0ABY4HZS1_CHIFI|nr:SRPBCC domain-containing protein [Chitinophaga filiformis]UPK68519.1 SRPBCC domain-containing protein [Chitinophaga filiformis]